VHSFDDLVLSDDDVGGSLFHHLRFLWLALLAHPSFRLLCPLLGQRGVSVGSRGGGVKLFYCQVSASVCGGSIRGSDGIQLCCKKAEDCQVETHKSTKEECEVRVLYVRASKVDQARDKTMSPCGTHSKKRISRTSCAEEETDVWVTCFKTLQDQHEQAAELDDKSTLGGPSVKTSASWAEVDVPILSDFSKARQNINIPRKLRLEAMLSTFSETVSEPLDDYEILNPLEQDADGKTKIRGIIEERSSVVKNFVVLSEEHLRRLSDDTKHGASIGEAVEEIQESVAECDRKTRLLTARIGSAADSSDDSASSLWEVGAGLHEAMLKGKGSFETLRRTQAILGK
jgi:hypothetical protein